jgi:menaquinone-dependent protoporphyrinogen IX oxidase
MPHELIPSSKEKNYLLQGSTHACSRPRGGHAGPSLPKYLFDGHLVCDKGVFLLGKILVTFDSGYGATAFVAETIAETLIKAGLKVDLRLVGLEEFSGYDALLVGSPIRLGRCTPKIRRFLKENLAALKYMQVAFFFTCMSVTNNELVQELPLYIDPSFADPDKPPARISFMENNHTVSYYLKHFLKIVPGIAPLGISFFKGRLNTAELNPFHRLIMWFAMFSLPEIQNGDFLNPAAIRAWAESIFGFGGGSTKPGV